MDHRVVHSGALQCCAIAAVGAETTRLNLFRIILRAFRKPHALSKIVELRAACGQDSDTAMSAGHDHAGQPVFVETLALRDSFIG